MSVPRTWTILAVEIWSGQRTSDPSTSSLDMVSMSGSLSIVWSPTELTHATISMPYCSSHTPSPHPMRSARCRKQERERVGVP